MKPTSNISTSTQQADRSTGLSGSYVRDQFGEETLLRLYPALLRPRLFEEQMLLQLRKGSVTKWFSGIGQEAISVGATLSMQSDEFILPLHRNVGVFLSRGISVSRLVAQCRGTRSGFTKGRDRSFHFGSLEHHIIGMISHLGPQLCVALGVALAYKLRKQKKAVLVFSGEGGTSEGDFHEALNVASVWELPVIFLVENNGYALSTPTKEQYRCKNLSDRASSYGIKGLTIEGNDLLEVYEAVSRAAIEVRQSQQPQLIEAITFRRRGHEEASGTKYVPESIMKAWESLDPVSRYEEILLDSGVAEQSQLEEFKSEIFTDIETEIEMALQDPDPEVLEERELQDVFADPPRDLSNIASSRETQEIRFVDAISDALRIAMREIPSLVLMGQDIAEYGGVFKVTEGFVQEFSKERVRNTPLCESAILGAAVGLSCCGIPSVVEMQFSDFVSSGFTQVVHNIAKLHYRWGHAVSTVIRMPCGGSVGAGPFHSQTSESWFVHCPGLKVVYPSTPTDAKGLLLSSIHDPNPVLFFEHKALYRKIRGHVPDGDYRIRLGEAHEILTGEDILIVTYGMGVHWAFDLASSYPDISVSILDLRTLVPLDFETIRKLVVRTGRVMVLHEASLTGGFGAELAAKIQEELFGSLDAPVMRCGSLDTPVPFHRKLEDQFMASARMKKVFERLIEY